MRRFWVGVVVVTMIMAASAVPLASIGGGLVATAETSPACSSAGVIGTSGTTVSLNEDCTTTAPLTPVPNGFTFNGNNHTITVSDPTGGHFSGAVLTNAGAMMNVENVTIDGPSTGLSVPTDCSLLLFGILFGPGASGAPGTDASGTVNNVHINNLFQQHDSFGNCQIGHAIRANAFAGPAQTVTITNTVVTGYQKGGLTASGPFMTMDASNDTIGPPAPLEGYIAPNGVQFGGGGANQGAGGKLSTSKIFGSGDRAPTPPGIEAGGDTDASAVLLYGAKNVTVTDNTITGAKTNIGVWVASASEGAPTTGAVVSFNHIERTEPDVPDPTGYGIDVDPSQATLICNTFSGWNKDIVGGIQVSCAPLPGGTCGSAYSTPPLTVYGGTAPFIWSASGALPPGLNFAKSGAITGTPTKAGAYPFAAHVVDSSSPPLTASQDLSITIAGASCALPPEEQGENPSIPESSEPGEAPTAPITPGTVPVTG